MTKRSILLVLALTLLSSVWAQSKLNHLDAKGRKQGHWKKIDPSGLSYTGQFHDDKPYGTFTYTDGQGRVTAIAEYFRDGYASFTRIFDTTGQLRMSGYYLDQLRDSLWQFRDASGRLIKEENYQQNLLHGMAYLWNKDSTLLERTEWFRGLRNGLWWQKSNAGYQQVNYKLNLSHGEYTARYPDSTIKIQGVYDQGLKEGAWDFFDDSARLEKRVYYEANHEVKKEVAIWTNGVMRMVCSDTVAFIHTNGVVTELYMNSSQTLRSDASFERLLGLFDTEYFFLANTKILVSYSQIKTIEPLEGTALEDEPLGILHLKIETPYEFMLDQNGWDAVHSLLNTKAVGE